MQRVSTELQSERRPERQSGQRGRAPFCVPVAMLVVCLIAPFPAVAEGHPVRVRPRLVPRQTELVPEHQKPGQKAKAGTNKGTAQSSKTTKGSARHTPAGAVDATKAGGHAKSKRRTREQQEDAPDPVLLRRTEFDSKMKAGRPKASTKEMARTVSPQHGKVPAAKAEGAGSAVAIGKSLTVDDFVRAAGPTNAVATNGEAYARPDADMSSSTLRKPILALKPAAVQRPSIVAKVEAIPARPKAPAPVTRVAPADLTGEPVGSMPEDASPMGDEASVLPVMRETAPIGRLPAPTRQELTDEVEQPVVLPGLYRSGRLVVPAPLKGTREILVHQNTMADDEGLERIQDEYDLHRLRAAHLLVDFPESASLRINPELGMDRRCARVWTVKFAADIARGYYARFHEPLQVNSAVRTVEYQVRLARTNGNAAGIDGETASPHLTGQAMDLAKRGMSMAQIAWMRSYLLPWMQAGKIDVEEEFQQACFHISVYRSYLPAPAKRRVPRTEVAQLRPEPHMAKAITRGDDLR